MTTTVSSRRLLVLGALAALGLTGARPADAVQSLPAAAQTLNGQAVRLDFLFPSKTAAGENDGTQTVTTAGVTFVSFKQVYTTVTPDRISVKYTGGGRFHPAGFNGIRLTEVGSKPAAITSVTVDPSSKIQNYGSRISFDSTHVYVNFQGLYPHSVDGLILDVQTR